VLIEPSARPHRRLAQPANASLSNGPKTREAVTRGKLAPGVGGNAWKNLREVAEHFGVHRTTVGIYLRRRAVPVRRGRLTAAQVR
jgi:hypothetical protein